MSLLMLFALGGSSSAGEGGSYESAVVLTDYGGVGDGSTNNFTALQSAIATGKDVVIPTGTFLVNAANIGSTLQLQAGQNIYGLGSKSILKTTANAGIIRLNTDNIITGVKFVGSGEGVGSLEDQTFILSEANKRGLVFNCWFQDCAGTAADDNYGAAVAISEIADASPSYDGVEVSNCVFRNNTVGVYLGITGEYCGVHNNLFTGNTTGLKAQGGNYNITGNRFVENATGVYIYQGSNSAHGVFANNTCNHNTTNIHVFGITGGQEFAGNKFFAGNIELNTCVGVRFNGGDIKGSVTINLTGNAAVYMGAGINYHSGTITKNLVSGADITFDGTEVNV